jgi:myo-inositol-1(or 4)-monophosphatase
MNPVLGVIYDFNNSDLYEGHLDGEAKLNEIVIKVSDTTLPSEGILVTGLPNNTDYSDQALLGMVKDFQKWRKVRMIGSAAIASCYVASAKADVYKEFGTYIWDVAAGAAIVNASGGRAEITNKRDNFQVDVHFSNSYILD